MQPVPALWRLPVIQIRANPSTCQVLEYQLLPWDTLYKVPVQTNFTGSKHTAVTELGLVYLQSCNRGRLRKAVPVCVLTAVSHLRTGHCRGCQRRVPVLRHSALPAKCQKLTRIFGWINCSDSNLKTLKHREKSSQDSFPKRGSPGSCILHRGLVENWWRGDIQTFVHLGSRQINPNLKAHDKQIFPDSLLNTSNRNRAGICCWSKWKNLLS